MSKTLQTVVVKSKYGEITNVFTAVRSMKNLIDETFPKYIENQQSFAEDGKRTVTFRDGSTKVGGVREQVFTTYADDRAGDAVAYSNTGKRMERHVSLTQEGYIKMTRKYNDQECFEKCEEYSPFSQLIQILSEHPNFEIIESSQKQL